MLRSGFEPPWASTVSTSVDARIRGTAHEIVGDIRVRS
jgi:hypothetical protein